MKKEFGLVPLRNFGILDEGRNIYRSAQPLYRYEYKWLHNVLGIKVIFDLRPENIDIRSVKGIGIKIKQFRVKDHEIPTVIQANRFIADVTKLREPALIHCTHGHGRTSTFSVLARVALGWSVKDAIKEEKERFHYEFKHELQEEFLLKNY